MLLWVLAVICLLVELIIQFASQIEFHMSAKPVVVDEPMAEKKADATVESAASFPSRCLFNLHAREFEYTVGGGAFFVNDLESFFEQALHASIEPGLSELGQGVLVLVLFEEFGVLVDKGLVGLGVVELLDSLVEEVHAVNVVVGSVGLDGEGVIIHIAVAVRGDFDHEGLESVSLLFGDNNGVLGVPVFLGLSLGSKEFEESEAGAGVGCFGGGPGRHS